MECSFEGCWRKRIAKGFCHSHYRQMRAGGPLLPISLQAPPAECSYPSCGLVSTARSLCRAHYWQFYSGKRLSPLGEPATPARRFISRIEVAESCWEWTGHLSRGYGSFTIGNRSMMAHRWAYEARNGPIPEGLCVDHVCRNKACVKPSHLRLATTKQNAENQTGRSNSITGVRGVTVEKGKYRVHVTHKGKGHYGGRFADLEEARLAAIGLRNELFTHNVEQ